MNPTKKKEILKILDGKIKKARVRAEKTLKTAKHFRSASRSQQGDKLYFQNTAKITEDHLLELLELKKEIIAASNESFSTVRPICFVEIEYQDGQTNQFYFLEKGTKLQDLQLLTPGSPLGESINGKKEGDNFSYQAGKNDQAVTYSGRIKKIE